MKIRSYFDISSSRCTIHDAHFKRRQLYIFNSDHDNVVFAIFHICNASPQRLQIYFFHQVLNKRAIQENLTNVINKHFIGLSLGDIRFIQRELNKSDIPSFQTDNLYLFYYFFFFFLFFFIFYSQAEVHNTLFFLSIMAV